MSEPDDPKSPPRQINSSKGPFKFTSLIRFIFYVYMFVSEQNKNNSDLDVASAKKQSSGASNLVSMGGAQEE